MFIPDPPPPLLKVMERRRSLFNLINRGRPGGYAFSPPARPVSPTTSMDYPEFPCLSPNDRINVGDGAILSNMVLLDCLMCLTVVSACERRQ
jgi:hypothetical protein